MSIENQKAESNHELSNTGQDFNPLMESAPIEKAYHKANIAAEDIPEIIPDFEKVMPIAEVNQATENIEQPHVKSTQESFNQPMNELPKKEKRIAAELMATGAIDSYSFVLQNLVSPLGKFDKRKVEKLIVEGQIDSNLVVETGEGVLPLNNFIDGFNNNIDNIVRVDEDFKEKIKGPLTNIFEKRGIGFTDEQYVGLEVIKDFGLKMVVLFQMKSDIKTMTENFVQRTNEMKNGNYAQSQQTAQQFSSSPIADDEISLENPNKKPIIVDEEGVTHAKEEIKFPIDNMKSQSTMPDIGNQDILAHMAQAESNPRNKNTQTPKAPKAPRNRTIKGQSNPK